MLSKSKRRVINLEWLDILSLFITCIILTAMNNREAVMSRRKRLLAAPSAVDCVDLLPRKVRNFRGALNAPLLFFTGFQQVGPNSLPFVILL